MIRSFKYLLAPALLIAASGLASAATLTQNFDLASMPTNWFSNITVAKFNPTMGTLNSVTFGLTGTVSGSITLTNNNPNTAATVSDALSAKVSLSRPGGADIVVVIPISSFTDTIGAGGTVTHSISASQFNSAQSLCPSGDCTMFSGLGGLNLPLSALGQSQLFGASNISAQFVTNASAHAVITYDYTAANSGTFESGVPEPTSLLLFGSGLGLLGLIRRRFSK